MGGPSMKNFKVAGKGDAYNTRVSTSRNKYQRSTSLIQWNMPTALVVDNNRLSRLVHKTLLNRLGIENHEVENGQQAVDLFRAGAFFDLILMDYEMPVMTGPEATRTLREMGVRSMIVGVTAISGESDRTAFTEAGLDAYLEKPLTHASLISILQELNNRRNP